MKIFDRAKFIVFIVNIVLLLALIAMDVVYIIKGTLTIKGVTSAIFVVIGLVNLGLAIKEKVELKFPIIMMIGLVFAMLGDVLLEVEYIVGALFFAIGHIFFFVSYIFLNSFSWKDLIYGAVIFLPSMLFIVLAPIFEFDGVLMELVCVIYALIISSMVGKAVANLVKERSILNIIITIGSIMFFLSDLMLLLGTFASLPVVGIICLALYYPAEFLLAFSILVYVLFSKKEQMPVKVESEEAGAEKKN